MRIIFSIDSLYIGGKEKQFSLIIQKLLEQRKIKIYVIVLNEINSFADRLSKADKIYIIKKNRKNIFRYFFSLIKIVKKSSPDIIHCWDSLSYFLLLPIAKYKKIKIINGVIRYSKKPKPYSLEWVISKLFFLSNVIVANSYAGLNSHGLIPSLKNRVIYNGYENESNNNSDVQLLKDKYAIKTTYVIIMVANFLESKDYSTFIKAAEIMLEKKYSITFLCVGRGLMLSQYRQLINFIYKESFRFMNNIDNPSELIQLSDIGVLTSNTINHSEGMPNTLIEYMAQSKPVIAIDIGGVSELVKDGENGFLINGKNHVLLAEKMEVLLNNKDLAHSFGEKGRILIKTKFNINNIVDQYYKLYQELADCK
jgi:glycosyltransferase involved in cell wall biosynthesis